MKTTWVRRFSTKATLTSTIFAGAILTHTVNAATIVLSDFDNTIVETRESSDGTFETPWVLFRIDQRSNTLQETATGPAEVLLTPIEYHRNKLYFGKGPGQPGALNRTIKLKDGTSIQPGNYYARNPDTFRYFFSTSDRNHVLEDLKEARARVEGTWKGPFWETMVGILSDEETAKSFGIITARGHSEQHWVEFFNYLQAEGEIKHLPNFRLFHNVSRPEYDQFSLDWSTKEQKTAVLKEIVKHLSRTPAMEERLSPDGKSREPYHYVIFADDNQDTLDHAIRALAQFAQNRTARVKFGIFNMGNRTEITSSRRPQFAIIKPDGTFRHATPEEIQGEPAQAKASADVVCAELVAQES